MVDLRIHRSDPSRWVRHIGAASPHHERLPPQLVQISTERLQRWPSAEFSVGSSERPKSERSALPWDGHANLNSSSEWPGKTCRCPGSRPEDISSDLP